VTSGWVTEGDRLQVECCGAGPRVLLVHGSVTSARLTWRRQRPLAERYRLVAPNRPGFADSVPCGRSDFDVDVRELLPLLEPGAHLVGHSYGAVVSLLLAARLPSAVRSLTVVEPPAFHLAAGRPEVDRFIVDMEELWRSGPADPVAFLYEFSGRIGVPLPPADRLSEAVRQGAALLRDERLPWEAPVSLPAIADAGIPVLVVSGDHHPVFERVCDVIASALGARRAVLPGAGHSVPRTGEPFNRLLEDFLNDVESGAPTSDA
jgi:pimeloyl-ACP methyl ester carboxylesterase